MLTLAHLFKMDQVFLTFASFLLCLSLCSHESLTALSGLDLVQFGGARRRQVNVPTQAFSVRIRWEQMLMWLLGCCARLAVASGIADHRGPSFLLWDYTGIRCGFLLFFAGVNEVHLVIGDWTSLFTQVERWRSLQQPIALGYPSRFPSSGRRILLLGWGRYRRMVILRKLLLLWMIVSSLFLVVSLTLIIVLMVAEGDADGGWFCVAGLLAALTTVGLGCEAHVCCRLGLSFAADGVLFVTS